MNLGIKLKLKCFKFLTFQITKLHLTIVLHLLTKQFNSFIFYWYLYSKNLLSLKKNKEQKLHYFGRFKYKYLILTL